MKSIIAIAQTEACGDYKINLKKAERIIPKAASKGAALVVFPECFMALASTDTPLEEKLTGTQSIDGDFASEIRRLAKEAGIWVVFGMHEPAEGKKNYNTVVVVNGDGEIFSTYRKSHLYDAFNYKESDYIVPGNGIFEPIDTPFGKLGILICYEIRFPEIARKMALSGAELIVAPTAWVKGKGKVEQLEIMTRARALENTVYLALADSCGKDRAGNSALVGPLGNIIVSAGESEEVLYGEIDTEKIASVRRALPVLENRRPEIY